MAKQKTEDVSRRVELKAALKAGMKTGYEMGFDAAVGLVERLEESFGENDFAREMKRCRATIIQNSFKTIDEVAK